MCCAVLCCAVLALYPFCAKAFALHQKDMGNNIAAVVGIVVGDVDSSGLRDAMVSLLALMLTNIISVCHASACYCAGFV